MQTDIQENKKQSELAYSKYMKFKKLHGELSVSNGDTKAMLE